MFFVIISISIYIFGIYLILVLSNCNAIQSTDCHVRYFNKLSIYLSIMPKVAPWKLAILAKMAILAKIARGLVIIAINVPDPWRLAILVKMAIVAKLAILAKNR